jgi:hypothetical protein
MAETLTEKVARAIMDITSCDLVSAPGRCLVDRAGSCYCREEARAAIAVVIEEAVDICDDWSMPQTMKLHAGEMSAQELRTAIAVLSGVKAAIRRLAE